MGRPSWFPLATRCWRQTYLTVFFRWTIFSEDCIQGIFCGVYIFWAMGKSLEDLGTTQMPFLCLVGHSQAMLDSRLPCTPWTPSSWALPFVWPGCGDYWSSLGLCKRVLVSAIFLDWTPSLFPTATETSFHNWWERVSNADSEMLRKGINSLIILGAWTLWTHCNKCVFDGADPSVVGALAVAEEGRRSWSLMGARGLSLLATFTLGG